jgi:E3 ubiquitin-protein ligase DOA10
MAEEKFEEERFMKMLVNLKDTQESIQENCDFFSYFLKVFAWFLFLTVYVAVFWIRYVWAIRSCYNPLKIRILPFFSPGFIHWKPTTTKEEKISANVIWGINMKRK